MERNMNGIEDILKALADGKYDGERSDGELNGVVSGSYIENGTPVRYRQGPSPKDSDGSETSTTPHTRAEQRFETEEEKTAFFQKYGFKRDLFGNHPEVIEFSRAYYWDEKSE